MELFTGSKKVFKIDSPEKAYTLGFLWGDGTLNVHKKKDGTASQVYYPRLEIVKDDLKKIIKLFSVWGKWKAYYRNRPRRKPQGVIQIFDKDFGWFLAQNDYLIKSSTEPTKILSLIPKKLKHYWWRGWVDADGCFYFHPKQYLKQFSLAGSFKNTWEEAENLFKGININDYEKQYRDEKSKSSVIRMSNRESIIKLGDYLYSGEMFGLKRKHNIFIQIKKTKDAVNKSKKLTASQVKQIRKLFASGKANKSELAKMFGVSRSNIRFIVSNKTWIKI